MQDLNDFVWFVKVVDYGGFAAAGRALDLPKSRLSRRIAQLEERLGVAAYPPNNPTVYGDRGRADLLPAL